MGDKEEKWMMISLSWNLIAAGRLMLKESKEKERAKRAIVNTDKIALINTINSLRNKTLIMSFSLTRMANL